MKMLRRPVAHQGHPRCVQAGTPWPLPIQASRQTDIILESRLNPLTTQSNPVQNDKKTDPHERFQIRVSLVCTQAPPNAQTETQTRLAASLVAPRLRLT